MFTPLLDVRGRLALDRGDLDAALDDLMEAGNRARRWGSRTSTLLSWRTNGAIALVALGQRERAEELAAEAVEFGRSFGAPRGIGIGLMGLARVRSGEEGIELLREAVGVLEGSGADLELGRAHHDLGVALRVAGTPRDAREPLRRALDLANQSGGRALAESALAELRVAGARPRRREVSGRDALTASERRIADMAVGGASNREIAQGLFVTVKTVETHLGRVYRKLDIHSRAELPDALARVADEPR
jgi:DNA-binding CsgD family transcriptional regulator